MTTTRRGFTLLEMALATALGSIVVLAAVSIFASLGTAQKWGQEAFDETNAAALTHETIAKAFGVLAMSDTTPPPQRASGERSRPEIEDEAADEQPRTLERPRMTLAPDEALPPIMEDLASRSGELMHPQRFELTLRSRPIYVFGIEIDASAEELGLIDPAPVSGSSSRTDEGGRPLEGTALDGTPDGAAADTRGSGSSGRAGDRRREDRDRRDRERDRDAESGVAGRDRPERRGSARESEREALAQAEAAVELVQGFRGAFEFEFDPGINNGGQEPDPGWVLWWHQIYPAVEAPLDVEPGPGQRVGAVRLMGNIAAAEWNVLYTKKSGQEAQAERLREHAAVWHDELPGYVELDILSNTGTRHQWTFEIGWGALREPGSVVQVAGTAAQITGAAGVTGANTTDRSRTPTASDASDRDRDRPRRTGSGRSSGSSGRSSGGGGGNEERRR